MRLYGILPCTLWLTITVAFVPSPEVLGQVVVREHLVLKDHILFRLGPFFELSLAERKESSTHVAEVTEQAKRLDKEVGELP